MAELENCEHIETVYLTPDAAQWDPYDEAYAAAEDRFLDFRGDLIHRPPKRRKILDDADVFLSFRYLRNSMKLPLVQLLVKMKQMLSNLEMMMIHLLLSTNTLTLSEMRTTCRLLLQT